MFAGHSLSYGSSSEAYAGHRHWQSLWPYLVLALDELGGWDTSGKALSLRSYLEATLRKIQTLKNNLDLTGLDVQEQIQEAEKRIKPFFNTNIFTRIFMCKTHHLTDSVKSSLISSLLWGATPNSNTNI